MYHTHQRTLQTPQQQTSQPEYGEYPREAQYYPHMISTGYYEYPPEYMHPYATSVSHPTEYSQSRPSSAVRHVSTTGRSTGTDVVGSGTPADASGAHTALAAQSLQQATGMDAPRSHEKGGGYGGGSTHSFAVPPKIKFRKDRFATSVGEPSEEEDKRTYRLIVSQQPVRARMCGFGEKDRRPIDPPPIVQLDIRDEKGNIDFNMLQNPFFVLHVTLWSDDGNDDRNVISNPPKETRVLMGSLVSSPALLKNCEGEQGLYFCFPDLSVRCEGRFTLKFSLMKLGLENRIISQYASVIISVLSEPFTVYSAKKFPGMTESTKLSKAFARQGLKIPIRNDVRPRKHISSEDEEDD